jgi:cytochrome c2
MKIGDFLLRRLKEAGVQLLFGVPGDYNLELLQQLQDSGALKWIGTCSELNASCAADGYARLKGLGALLVSSLQNYSYSSAMKGAGFTWDKAKLDGFIANTEQIVPGNNMKPFSGLAVADDRAKVIAFLVSGAIDEK